jgi:hypothetical protein
MEVKVLVTIDGRPVPGFDPYMRKLELAETLANTFGTPGDTPSAFIDAPGGDAMIGSVRVFGAVNDKSAVLWRRGKDSTSIGIPINAGGLFLLVDCGIGTVLGDGESPFEFDDNEITNQVHVVQGGS